MTITQPSGTPARLTVDTTANDSRVLIGVYADGSPAYAVLSAPDVAQLVCELLARCPAARGLLSASGVTP